MIGARTSNRDEQATLSAFSRTVAANVRDARLRRGLSQAELARQCGLSRSCICSFENNGGNIRLESLFRIAVALRVRVRDLVSVSDDR